MPTLQLCIPMVKWTMWRWCEVPMWKSKTLSHTRELHIQHLEPESMLNSRGSNHHIH